MLSNPNPAVREEIIGKSHVSTDGSMRDICDGDFVKKHPVFRAHPDGLQFLLYHDDIEVCNPLGTSAGVHKFGENCITCWFIPFYNDM